MVLVSVLVGDIRVIKELQSDSDRQTAPPSKKYINKLLKRALVRSESKVLQKRFPPEAHQSRLLKIHPAGAIG